MKRRFELLFAAILVILLVIAFFINNSIIKGILLLLFTGVLIYNTVMKLKGKPEIKFRAKFFYGILLFLEVVLALGAIFVTFLAVINV